MPGLDNALADGAFNARNPLDFYPTPWNVIEIILQVIKDSEAPIYSIVDVGAGTGRWGAVARSLWPEARIIGYESADLTVAQRHRIKARGYTELHTGGETGDYLKSSRLLHYDLMMGNPPFYLFSKPSGDNFFDRLQRQRIHHRSNIALFAPTSFYSTEYRWNWVFNNYPPSHDLRFMQRVSFYTEGHPRCGDSGARLYCAPLWLTDTMTTKVRYIPSHHNDNTYTGPFLGTDTWAEMCEIGLVPEDDSNYVTTEEISMI